MLGHNIHFKLNSEEILLDMTLLYERAVLNCGRYRLADWLDQRHRVQNALADYVHAQRSEPAREMLIQAGRDAEAWFQHGLTESGKKCWQRLVRRAKRFDSELRVDFPDGLTFPLAFLYRNGKSPKWQDGFFGTRYKIGSFFSQSGAYDVRPYRKRLSSDGIPKVFHVTDDALAAAKMERQHLRDLEQAGKIRLRVPPEDKIDDPNLADFVVEACWGDGRNGVDIDILHFSCHLGSEACDYLEIGKGRRLRPDAVHRVERSRLPRLAPIVFFNTCNSAVATPTRTTGFVEAWQDEHCSGVIATTGLVEDGLAAIVSRRFYENMIRGKDVGDALFSTVENILYRDGHVDVIAYGPFNLNFQLTLNSENKKP